MALNTAYICFVRTTGVADISRCHIMTDDAHIFSEALSSVWIGSHCHRIEGDESEQGHQAIAEDGTVIGHDDINLLNKRILYIRRCVIRVRSTGFGH